MYKDLNHVSERRSPPVYFCFGVRVLVTQYTFQITFNGKPDFVASVPQVIRPASSEALSCVLSFLVFFLSCLDLVVVYFIF
jgi:hypothetical protein